MKQNRRNRQIIRALSLIVLLFNALIMSLLSNSWLNLIALLIALFVYDKSK
jgi:hypothetical protein